MKVEYAINAEGSAEVTQIREVLASIGLKVILVEKMVDTGDLLRDENFARDENFEISWTAVRESGLLPESIEKELAAVYGDTTMLTADALLNSICGISADVDITNQELEKTLRQLIRFLNTQ